MILGLGTDLVDVEAFAAQLADTASVFAETTFTPTEHSYARTAVSGAPAQHLAARYAAKEAVLKALDQACAVKAVEPPSIALSEIEVVRDVRGRPSLSLHGKAAALANTLAIDRLHVSLSHDGRYATATVVCEAFS